MTAELEQTEINYEELDFIEEERVPFLSARLVSKFKSAQLNDEQIDFIDRNATEIEIAEAIAFYGVNLQYAAPDGASAANQIIYIATQAKSPEVIKAVIDKIDKHLEHNSFYRVVEVIANSATIEEAQKQLSLSRQLAVATEPSNPVAEKREKIQQLAQVA